MPPEGICTRDNSCFRNRLMLDKCALQFEGAQTIIGTFEDVIGAPNVSESSIRIAVSHISRAIVAASETSLGPFRIIKVAKH